MASTRESAVLKFQSHFGSMFGGLGAYDEDDLFCLRDIKGHILSVNTAWEKLLDYPLQEIANRPLIDLVHPDDRLATRRTMSLVNDRHSAVAFKNRYRTRGGEYRALEWRAGRSGDFIVGIARHIALPADASPALEAFA
jgi:PAS domain S-box-containing protein